MHVHIPGKKCNIVFILVGGGSQEYDTIKYDYAGVGPHVYSDIESKPSEYEVLGYFKLLPTEWLAVLASFQVYMHAL